MLTDNTIAGATGAEMDELATGPIADHLYRELIDKSDLGMFVLYRFRFRFVNKGLLKMLGCSGPEQLLGREIWEIAGPDDREKLELRLTWHNDDRAYQGDPEFTYTLDDGSKIYLKVLLFASSQQDLMLGSLVDITEHHSTILRLRDSRQRYYDTLEEVEDGILEVDLPGRITWCNPACERIYGYTREELMRMDYRSYMDEDVARRVFKAFNQVFRTGKPNKAFPYEIITGDGTRRIIENSISLKRSADGIPIGFRSVVREATVRIKAEEELARQRTRLGAIFSSVKDAIVTVDNDMKIIEANHAAGTICGIATGQVMAQSFIDRPSHCSIACREVLQETIHRGTTVNEYRIECGHQFRDRQEVVLTSSSLKDRDGNNMGAVLLARDVTRLLSLERELKEKHRYHAMVGKSQAMQSIFELLEDLSDIETTVLITGESGTGKGMVARALHNNGNRAFGQFITVNCSALPESLMESELFGHVKGAFTGAIKDKPGRFQVAEGGVILLDEIGEISPMIQLKLLRVLQDKEFERVGDSRPLKADVRVIACTNANLEEKVSRGEFREDLYYRLKVMEIRMPSLRERLEDIPLLVEHFCRSFNRNFNKEITGVSDDVYRYLMSYSWPGNIRELEHAIEHGFVLCQGSTIGLEHLPRDIQESSRIRRQRVEQTPEAEKAEILDTLRKTDWNKAKAARLLSIDRSTLYRKLKLYELKREGDDV